MTVPLKLDTTAIIDGDDILNALPHAILLIDQDGTIKQVNSAAEQLFKKSSAVLTGRLLSQHLPTDSPVFSLIEQAASAHASVSEHGITLETPRISRRLINVMICPLPEHPGLMLVMFQERSIAEHIDRQLTHRGAARSVTAMGAMLAHEVKNPLSGIRGAAQLLEDNVSEDDQALTTLIRDEVDRICDLVDRMEFFADDTIPERSAVNIHIVLDRVRRLALNGFGRHVRIIENYDPSLPPVLGNKDQLVQVFLNLVKNAAESVSQSGGEIILTTAYKHGVRFAVPGSDSRVHLPLMISVHDNGAGVPDDLRDNLFDPFVTSKAKGSGLGLALVAKIVGDHGGVIECNNEGNMTVFRIMLPMASVAEEKT